ncbi:MAG: aconitate hydratase [Gracilimonas sp.]|uniref:aconitate hydratase n=1 Tax=Gracilimonas TaxID=649462 RepID=UPI001B233D82|nr:aconitate hydratase [Gracilimonas sp.]MBO6586535.1 aconitate hydratase [Gracilimonas sp.]MBO6615192.1 aconitate hydratase [Gracilimonas sp.]
MSKPLNVTQKLIQSHLVEGEMVPGQEIGLKIDQTLTQDATGTMVMLELEAMELDEAKTEISCQYVDHNLIQSDFKNPDDHVFLKSAAERFGMWFSRPGNGVSHPIETERFAIPGKTLAGSDSHTPASGCMGMLAIGSGGLDVAFAIAGEPLFIKMPKVLGVELKGELKDWVSAKDVVLEMLRRYDVDGASGYVIEYFGEGLKNLDTMDRHVIANMGTEMGATTTVFPADGEIRRFMETQKRGDEYVELLADEGAEYDKYEELILDDVEPLIALPSSPGNVVPVREVEGKDIYQSYIGSSANPGYRDFWISSEIVKGKTVNDNVSFDINPTSRQIIENMVKNDVMFNLVQSGARIHQAGCNGCIGMGQAPATGQNSLRTVPRNFPDRSGTPEDSVFLVSPETAAASALTGKITDPRDLEKLFNMEYPKYTPLKEVIVNTDMLTPPKPKEERGEIKKGPNISSMPNFGELEDFEVPVLLKMGDDISTDEILRAGTEVLPFRSNIPEISKFTLDVVDKNFHDRAMKAKEEHGGHVVIAGENYAQGSSREHAAIAPRYLGQRAVIAKSYARIGWQNLVNFGIPPFEFTSEEDYNDIEQGDVLKVENIRASIESGNTAKLVNVTKGTEYEVKHTLSDRQRQAVLDGGVINSFKKRKAS